MGEQMTEILQQIPTLCEQIKQAIGRLDKLEVKVNSMDGLIAETGKQAAVSKEQISMIFKILNEIKAGIDKVSNAIETQTKDFNSQSKEMSEKMAKDIEEKADQKDLEDLKSKIDTIEKKPVATWEIIRNGAIIAVITAFITYIFTKFV